MSTARRLRKPSRPRWSGCGRAIRFPDAASLRNRWRSPRSMSPKKNGAAEASAAPSLLEIVRRSELHSDAGVARGFRAGAVILTGRHAAGAGERPVVIEAELVLPVAVCHPDVDEVAPLVAPNRL